MSFNEIVNGWHDFYLLAGGAAATLTGLLFVAVSLHMDVLAHDRGENLRGVAGQILFNFIYVIIISLVVVSNVASGKLLFIFLVGTGGTGLARLLLRTYRLSRQQGDWLAQEIRQQPINIIGHFLLPVICFITLIGCGVSLLIAPEHIGTTLILLMLMIIYLLVRAIVDTWTMLIRVAIIKNTHALDRTS